MRLVGPIYRSGGDSRIDNQAWYSLPPVPVLINHQINKPFGRGELAWRDDLLMCSMPVAHPGKPDDFEEWGRLAFVPYLDFSYMIVHSASSDAPNGIQIAEVSLVHEPNIFGLPGWTLED